MTSHYWQGKKDLFEKTGQQISEQADDARRDEAFIKIEKAFSNMPAPANDFAQAVTPAAAVPEQGAKPVAPPPP